MAPPAVLSATSERERVVVSGVPRLFVLPERLEGETLILTGEAHHHLTNVLRLGAGDHVEVFDGCGREIDATILRTGPRQSVLGLGPSRRNERPARPPLVLLQGLARGERTDWVVQKATELGVARVVVFRARRSQAGQQMRIDRWTKIAREAARQAGRADLPEIALYESLADALASVPREWTLLVAWEEAPGSVPLRQAVPPNAAGVALMIGPKEGSALTRLVPRRPTGFASSRWARVSCARRRRRSRRRRWCKVCWAASTDGRTPVPGHPGPMSSSESRRPFRACLRCSC